MTHEQIRSLFVDALYGELGGSDKEQFQEHLRTCPSCSQEFEQLRSVAVTMDQRVRENLSPEDWKAFWNVLAAGIEGQRPTVTRHHTGFGEFLKRFSPAVRLAAAAIMILAIGIGIGRFAFSPGSGSPDEGGAGLTTAEKVALHQETMGYLERSKVLLLGIVNTEEVVPEKQQFSRQQEVSRVLVREGGDLQGRLSRSGQQELGALVNDLEVILLQIANLEVENDFPGLEVIRGGVDRKGIFLKINVEQMKAMQKKNQSSSSKDESTRSMI